VRTTFALVVYHLINFDSPTIISYIW